MKSMLALMAGTMMFAACSNDDVTENINEQKTSELKPMTFTATMEGQGGASRAAIDGLDIRWSKGDKITIFDGNADADGILAREFTLTGDGGSTSGTFTGTAATATTYYALYPYMESKFKSGEVTKEEAEAILEAVYLPSSFLEDWKSEYEYDPGTVEWYMSMYGLSEEAQTIILAYLKGEKLETKSGVQRNASDQFEEVVLPAVQTATAGSADKNAMLMIAKSENASTMEFKNVCAYVKVKPEFDCTKITIKSNGTESLAGTMTVDYNGGAPTTTVTKGAKTVILSGNIKANNTYYIAVRPGTLASGFTITFVAADYEYKKSTSNEVTFVRNDVTNLGSFATSNLTRAEMTGTATAIIGGVETNVKWSQLWAGGPKFAEYNVGATSATEYGGYYAWGGSENKSTTYKSGSAALTGTDDTATNLWGSNWRMPTQAEFQALLNNENCTCTWTNQDGVNGLLCTGYDAYSSNSVFLPAAGNYFDGRVSGQNNYGYYWSSTAIEGYEAYYLGFWYSGGKSVYSYERYYGLSVRAVLAEE